MRKNRKTIGKSPANENGRAPGERRDQMTPPHTTKQHPQKGHHGRIFSLYDVVRPDRALFTCATDTITLSKPLAKGHP